MQIRHEEHHVHRHDALTRLKMQDLVADLCARHRPDVLLVTHDVEEAVLPADRVLVLRQGGSAWT